MPEGLEALILTCLKKDPDERPQSALDMQEALQVFEESGGWGEAEARTWWDQNREELRRRRQPKPLTGPEQTMAIDLEDRPGIAKDE